jgi:nicotinamidase/pyrazinamidase
MREEKKVSLEDGDGLLIVDVQIDFCPGGALPIEEGDRIIPILNRWVEAAAGSGIPIYASRDWHPEHHVSFEEQGGEWPPHCVQDTKGAAFHPDLRLPGATVKVTKGVRLDKDQNSTFDETGLADQLRRDGVQRLWVGGLAQDVCVLATVLDARKEGFAVNLILDGTFPVSLEGGKEALQKMKNGRVVFVYTSPMPDKVEGICR